MTENLRLKVLSLPRPVKRLIVFFCDFITSITAVCLAFSLRFDKYTLDELLIRKNEIWQVCILALAISLPIFFKLGLYKDIFRYSERVAASAIVKSGLIYLIFFSGCIILLAIENVPRSIGIIQPVLFINFVILTRLVARVWLSRSYLSLIRTSAARKTIIYGAGQAGRETLAALSQNTNYDVLGFVDDNIHLQGNKINGKEIFSPTILSKFRDVKGVEKIIVAIPSETNQRRTKIVSGLNKLGFETQITTAISGLVDGKSRLDYFEKFSADSLLSRKIIPPFDDLMKKAVFNRNIFVSGAGGSIGRELCRQAIIFKPKNLILLDLNEYALYKIELEINKLNEDIGSPTNIRVYLGSILDEQLLMDIFKKEQPSVVYHAAAYKHVPIVEKNVTQGIQNNYFGTILLSKVAVAHKVRNFVLISSDKAVRPTNIMGATKRLAEKYLQALGQETSETNISVVRFGNVIASSGSVVPLFLKQIESGGPITITHKDASRYFISISEAATLVVQAGEITNRSSKRQRATKIFYLDMGKPIKIVTVAHRMISYFGFAPYDPKTGFGDIKIRFIGLRKGEKLREELYYNSKIIKTIHPKIFIAPEQKQKMAQLELINHQIQNAIATGEDDILSEIIMKSV